MQAFLDNPALELYALVSAILAIQLLLLAQWTAFVRARTKSWVNPEDVDPKKGEPVGIDHPDVLRVKRVHANLLENAVPFFAVGLLYALSNPSVTGARAYFFTFLGARILHSIFYLLGRQPFRTISFVVSVLALFGMAIHVIRASV